MLIMLIICNYCSVC